MKHSKQLESTYPMFVDAETTWSGGMHDNGPFFRQLPAVVAEPAKDIETESPAERRSAERRPLQLGIEVYGYDPDLSLIHAYGTTHDVSASGLYAHVDVDLPVGSRAVVAIRPSHPALEPSILRGEVVRCADETNGCGMAIHFDLDVERFAFEAA